MFSAHPRSVFSDTTMPVRKKKSVKSSSSPGRAVQHVSLPPLLIMFMSDLIIILPKHLLKPESTCPRFASAANYLSPWITDSVVWTATAVPMS
jgi:hypothetical protein